MARHRAGGHLSGTLGDGRHVGNLAAAVWASCPRSTGLANLTQRRQQLASQCASRQHIQTGIDGFCREVFSHIVRIRALEAISHLFWRAARPQLRLNLLLQPRVKEFPSPSWMMRSGGGVALRHCSERMAMSQTQTQGLTFFSTQMSVRSRVHSNTVAHQGW